MLAALLALAGTDTFVVDGSAGPGKGRHVVLLAGDEEYRSEEMLPQLAKILAKRHGFKCTVVFSLNEKGEIDPKEQANQPGIEALKSADVCVMMLRFRQWPDSQMAHFVDYYSRGKPIMALRTSTHAFDYPADSTSRYAKYGWNSALWQGGFGRQVLGESWVSHWGAHGSQATRGRVVAEHPVLRGVQDVFGTTDVYEASPPSDAEVLMRGEVVAGMSASDPPATGRKAKRGGIEQPINDPMMAILWVRSHQNEAGTTNRIMAFTMGSATDFVNPGFRRVLVNGVFWLGGLPVPPAADVALVGDYIPSPFGFDRFQLGRRPGDFR